MDAALRTAFDNLLSTDKNLRYEAFQQILAATDQPVGWAYEVWDGMVAALRHKDNHVRAIAAQVLCNLAKSDPQNKMLTDFDALYAVTRDERFVTARHCLQALWKVGAAGKPQQDMLVAALGERFQTCLSEKNGTLIRYDIVVGLRSLYVAVPDEAVQQTALKLIASEADLTYRRKYAAAWRRPAAGSA